MNKEKQDDVRNKLYSLLGDKNHKIAAAVAEEGIQTGRGGSIERQKTSGWQVGGTSEERNGLDVNSPLYTDNSSSNNSDKNNCNDSNRGSNKNIIKDNNSIDDVVYRSSGIISDSNNSNVNNDDNDNNGNASNAYNDDDGNNAKAENNANATAENNTNGVKKEDGVISKKDSI